MELHPFYEKDSTSPQSNLWYVLSTEGDPPSMRVGCTATFIDGKSNEEDGRLYVIGGANPDGTFAEINLLDLTTMTWDRLDTPSHVSRYEHAVSTFRENNGEASTSIFVFGGAVQNGNMNDIQRYSIPDDRWSTVAAQGNAPSARTQHSMSAFFNNGRLVVYGGGQSGSDPVTDRQTHIFDPSTSTWSTPYVTGQPPKPRHGHLIVTNCSNDPEKDGKVYVHGGMTGNVFYDDLFVLDLAKNQWSELKVGRRRPCNRAAHGGVLWKQKLYIFGGMCKNGALDDMWSFDIGSKSWTEIKYGGPPPPSRLDFACCLITLNRNPEEVATTSCAEEVPSSAAAVDDAVNGTKEPNDTCAAPDSKPADESSTATSVSISRSAAAAINVGTENEQQTQGRGETCVFFLICGGMDTEGTIFDDTLILMIDREPFCKGGEVEGAAGGDVC